MHHKQRPVPIQCVAVQVRATDAPGILRELADAQINGYAVVMDCGQCGELVRAANQLADKAHEFDPDGKP